MASPGSSVIAPRRGQLDVEILAQVADATLAVYADRELLLTKSPGAADQNKPLHLQYALPLGLRQLGVALYGPDESWQTEKEDWLKFVPVRPTSSPSEWPAIASF